MIKYILFPALIFLLIGCGEETRPTLVISTPSQNVEITQPRRPSPLELNDVNYVSYNREKLADIVSENDFQKLIGLSPTEFAKLAENIEDTAKYIEIQNAIISYYENTTKNLANKNKNKDEEDQQGQ